MSLDAPSTTPTRRRVTYDPNDPEGLKALREELEMTQTEVAEVAGVTHAMINRVESGLSGARDEVAMGIAEALNKPLEDLFHVREGQELPAR
jgi:transcriptional regulator with XRE-family HTH domain